jgi:hypothetical protein
MREVVQALVRLVQRANMIREFSTETLFGEAIIKTKISYDPSKTPLSPVNDVVIALLSLIYANVWISFS